jgi:two-component system, NtrC family, response regulator GlrR
MELPVPHEEAMSVGNVLVVDDDRNLLKIMQIRLESSNYGVTTAAREDDALRACRGHSFDLAIVDLQLARTNGISLMEELHHIRPEMPVIILTGHGSIESAVDAMRKGAYTYLTKPFNGEDLLFQIEKATANLKLLREIRKRKDILGGKFDFPDIVAKSDKMARILKTVAQIARTDSTVFIHGESGTGKELIAKAIHLASDRKDGPFVEVNCAALPEMLLESELFGHEKGAFTGAVKSKKGLIVQAREGTTFLDEIGDMPIATQAKLLRFLQERRFYPVGGEKIIDVDVRIVVATNKDLKEEIRHGRFREDLYYRIHVIPIYLPPLRERREDIPALADHFLKKFARQMKRPVAALTPEAMAKLLLHDWPGNVRELENTIEYAVAITQKDVVTDDVILQASGPHPAKPLKPLKAAKDEYEKNYLINLLEACGGSVSMAARNAGKYRADFYDLMKKHGLDGKAFRKNA